MKKSIKLIHLLEQIDPIDKRDSEEIKSLVVNFFKENPDPTDDKVHDFADKINLDPEELEMNIYSLLSDLLKKEEVYEPRDSSDEEQMKSGLEIEKEHTDTIKFLLKEVGIDPDSEIGKQLLEKTIGNIV